MWKWSAVLIVPIAYVMVDRMLRHYIVVGASPMGDIVLQYAPFSIGIIMLGLIVATLFR